MEWTKTKFRKPNHKQWVIGWMTETKVWGITQLQFFENPNGGLFYGAGDDVEDEPEYWSPLNFPSTTESDNQ